MPQPTSGDLVLLRTTTDGKVVANPCRQPASGDPVMMVATADGKVVPLSVTQPASGEQCFSLACTDKIVFNTIQSDVFYNTINEDGGFGSRYGGFEIYFETSESRFGVAGGEAELGYKLKVKLYIDPDIEVEYYLGNTLVEDPDNEDPVKNWDNIRMSGGSSVPISTDYTDTKPWGTEITFELDDYNPSGEAGNWRFNLPKIYTTTAEAQSDFAGYLTAEVYNKNDNLVGLGAYSSTMYTVVRDEPQSTWGWVGFEGGIVNPDPEEYEFRNIPKDEGVDSLHLFGREVYEKTEWQNIRRSNGSEGSSDLTNPSYVDSKWDDQITEFYTTERLVAPHILSDADESGYSGGYYETGTENVWERSIATPKYLSLNTSDQWGVDESIGSSEPQYQQQFQRHYPADALYSNKDDYQDVAELLLLGDTTGFHAPSKTVTLSNIVGFVGSGYYIWQTELRGIVFFTETEPSIAYQGSPRILLAGYQRYFRYDDGTGISKSLPDNGITFKVAWGTADYSFEHLPDFNEVLDDWDSTTITVNDLTQEWEFESPSDPEDEVIIKKDEFEFYEIETNYSTPQGKYFGVAIYPDPASSPTNIGDQGGGDLRDVYQFRMEKPIVAWDHYDDSPPVGGPPEEEE